MRTTNIIQLIAITGVTNSTQAQPTGEWNTDNTSFRVLMGAFTVGAVVLLCLICACRRNTNRQPYTPAEAEPLMAADAKLTSIQSSQPAISSYGATQNDLALSLDQKESTFSHTGEPDKSLKVRNLAGIDFNIRCSSQDTILDIKKRIEKMLHYPIHDQKIIYLGKALGNNETYTSCQLNPDHVVHLVVKRPSHNRNSLHNNSNDDTHVGISSNTTGNCRIM